MKSFARRLSILAAGGGLIAAAATVAPSAGASVPAIPSQAFGMHYLNQSHPYPSVPFAAGRIWDAGVNWAQLQPSSTDMLDPAVNSHVAQLDAIVGRLRSHGVDPLYTMGQTPAWAAASCNHTYAGIDYGVQTCPPADTSPTGPWGQYVTFLATHYVGSLNITYFELWNEPSLASSYGGSAATLAQMQATAYSILHAHGKKMVSPGVAFTNGTNPKTHVNGGQEWLTSFLKSPGGKSYDVLGLHLYPNDASARAGIGPEWSMNQALVFAKAALTAAKAPSRTIFDTEHNVGRQYAKTGYKDGSAGAAPVARTFILATENRIARTYWYAADDRGWGGTWLLKSDYKTLSPSGVAERTVRNLLVGKAALGCSQPKGTTKGTYQCRFGTTTGHKTLLAIWTTGTKFTYKAPKGTKSYYTVTGGHAGAGAGHRFTITGTPIYLSGSFA